MYRNILVVVFLFVLTCCVETASAQKPVRISATVKYGQSIASWGGPTEHDRTTIPSSGIIELPLAANTPEQFERQLKLAIQGQKDQLAAHQANVKAASADYALSHTSHKSYHYNHNHTTTNVTNVTVATPIVGQCCGSYSCGCGVYRPVYWSGSAPYYTCPRNGRVYIYRGTPAWGRTVWSYPL